MQKKDLGLLVLILVVGAITTALNPVFLSPVNLGNMANLVGLFGIFSIGIGVVIAISIEQCSERRLGCLHSALVIGEFENRREQRTHAIVAETRLEPLDHFEAARREHYSGLAADRRGRGSILRRPRGDRIGEKHDIHEPRCQQDAEPFGTEAPDPNDLDP